MRLLQRLGWISAIFGLLALGGQLWADYGSFAFSVSFRALLAIFIQGLWLVFLGGSVAMGLQRYGGRWAVALSSLLLLGELISFEVLPALTHGWKDAIDIWSLTWPGVVMGRGPLSFVILSCVAFTVITKGLARRPSSIRRGGSGEHLRTRETDR